MLCKLKGPGHCTSEKRMNSILRQVAEAGISLARQGTILNSHRVIRNATNTSMVLNYALVTYIMMTADVELPADVIPPGCTSYPQDDVAYLFYSRLSEPVLLSLIICFCFWYSQ